MTVKVEKTRIHVRTIINIVATELLFPGDRILYSTDNRLIIYAAIALRICFSVILSYFSIEILTKRDRMLRLDPKWLKGYIYIK